MPQSCAGSVRVLHNVHLIEVSLHLGLLLKIKALLLQPADQTDGA